MRCLEVFRRQVFTPVDWNGIACYNIIRCKYRNNISHLSTRVFGPLPITHTHTHISPTTIYMTITALADMKANCMAANFRMLSLVIISSVLIINLPYEEFTQFVTKLYNKSRQPYYVNMIIPTGMGLIRYSFITYSNNDLGAKRMTTVYAKACTSSHVFRHFLSEQIIHYVITHGKFSCIVLFSDIFVDKTPWFFIW